MTLELKTNVIIKRHVHQPGLIICGAVIPQLALHSHSSTNSEVRFVGQDIAASSSLLSMLHRANMRFPAALKDLDIASHDLEGTIKQSQEAVQSDHKLSEKIESDTEQEVATPSAQKSTKDRDAQTLSPLQVKMQRLSAAASKFDTEPYEEQSATIGQLGDETILARHKQQPLQIQAHGGSSRDTLTALEHQVLHHLTEDLKSRPGSYIGQNTTAIASALSRPLSEIVAATESLSKQNYIHSTIDASTWVISQAPAELRVLSERQQETPLHPLIAPSIALSTDKSEKSDLLFQMELLEQQIMSYFTTFRSTTLLERGCKSQDLAKALSKDVNEVELALHQLAEQGRVHLASDGETWNTSLPRQHIPSEEGHIRDATDFQDTPPSPVIPAMRTAAQIPPIDTVDATDLETFDGAEDSGYPPHVGIRWTRIDKSYVDPQVLVDEHEEFHEEGYSLIVHRVLRRGELKQWVQKTLNFRLQKTETARARRCKWAYVAEQDKG